MEKVTATVELQKHCSLFTLHKRSLPLGPAGPVDYYWIDSSTLRHRPPGPNFRSCVDLWWAAAHEFDAVDDTEVQTTRVLAECYPLVNTARSLQDVYLDAQLNPNVEAHHAKSRWGDRRLTLAECPASLSSDLTEHLRTVADSRDTARVRAELESLFLGPIPPPEEMAAFREAARAWIGNGLVALRKQGVKGLSAHLATIKQWITRYRKRGGEDRARLFINLFASESKVAFYTCYANAWLYLIPWLREHRGLDPLSERLLRLWHSQNQPGEPVARNRQ